MLGAVTVTMLDKALASARHPATKQATFEEQDVALAWLRGDINGAQVRTVLGHKGQTGYYSFLNRCLRAAYTEGRLVETKISTTG